MGLRGACIVYASQEFFHIIEFPAAAAQNALTSVPRQSFSLRFYSGLICCSSCCRRYRRRRHLRHMSESLSKDGKRSSITFTFTNIYEYEVCVCMCISRHGAQKINDRQSIFFFIFSASPFDFTDDEFISISQSLHRSTHETSRRDAHTIFNITHEKKILFFRIVLAVRFLHSLVPVPFCDFLSFLSHVLSLSHGSRPPPQQIRKMCT